MTSTTNTSTVSTPFDTAALRRGIEGREPATLVALYHPDATIEIADATHGPSAPLSVQGRDAIAAHLDDVYGRDMQHAVDIVAASPEAVGYTVRCAYSDGTIVRCVAVAELRDGLITREIGAQAWDE
ncbi:MAG: hypothetical protein QOF86_3978 [Baekduia sp.]|nr:hypothetical protein [Baekduia sp.]